MTETTLSIKASAIVRRTAQFGLTQAQESPQQFEKWLLIWACDIAGELGEYIDSMDIVEAGDVLWGLTALCLLMDIPVEEVLHPDEHVNGIATKLGLLEILIKALGLLDVCKKITRDGIDKRPIDRTKLTEQMRLIFHWIDLQCDVDEALAAVDAKLLKRYPNGFTSEDSVNRIH